MQAQKRSKRKADGISPAAQALAAARYHAPAWDANPLEDAGWRTLVAKLAGATLPGVAKAREQLGVTMEATKVGSVKAFMFIPRSMPEAHRNQVIFNIHGGGYVYRPGESGTVEATLISGLVGYRVIALDYRMPPTRPNPAAMDDTVAATTDRPADRRRQHQHRRRHDARAHAACQRREPAAPHRYGAGHALGHVWCKCRHQTSSSLCFGEHLSGPNEAV